jgi:hypothetical protein
MFAVLIFPQLRDATIFVVKEWFPEARMGNLPIAS